MPTLAQTACWKAAATTSAATTRGSGFGAFSRPKDVAIDEVVFHQPVPLSFMVLLEAIVT